MIERIRGLVEAKTPFLIVKYKVSFIGIASSNYDLVTMYGSKLQYSSMERSEVTQALHMFDIPLLWDKGDNQEKIWGDMKFRERFKKGGYKI